MTEEKKQSTTKLVVIDTKTLHARSFEGTQEWGEVILPDPEADNFTAKEIIDELNGFLQQADGAIYRTEQENKKKERIAKAFIEAVATYDLMLETLFPEKFGVAVDA